MIEIGCAGCGSDTADSPTCSTCGEDPLLDGRYKLVERIGEGQVGVTWRGVRLAGGAVVAVKVAFISRDAHGAMLEARELRVLGEVAHPQLPRLVEALYRGAGQNRRRFLVQTHLEGQNLEQVLLYTRFSAKEVAKILRSAVEPLRWLHDRSPPILHRDIKPANLLLRDDGTVAVVDFSAVRDENVGTLGGNTLIGTFGYMAPEQFRGDAEPATDVFGLGATAIHLLTRQHPKSLADPHQRFTWKGLANAPVALTNLVERMVAREPRNRPTWPEIARVLDAVLTEDAPSHRAPTTRVSSPLPDPPGPRPVTFAEPLPSDMPEAPAAPIVKVSRAAELGLLVSAAVSVGLLVLIGIGMAIVVYAPVAEEPPVARVRPAPIPVPEARAPLAPPEVPRVPELPAIPTPRPPSPSLLAGDPSASGHLVAAHPAVLACHGGGPGEALTAVIVGPDGAQMAPVAHTRASHPAFSACVSGLVLPFTSPEPVGFLSRVKALRDPEEGPRGVLIDPPMVTVTVPQGEDFVVMSNGEAFRLRTGGTHTLPLSHAVSVFHHGETDPANVQVFLVKVKECSWAWGVGDQGTCASPPRPFVRNRGAIP